MKEVLLREPDESLPEFVLIFKKYSKGYVPLKKIRKKIKGKIADGIAREGLPD